MKKLIIILSFILVSCGYNAMDNRNSIIITDIEQDYPHNLQDNTLGCYYYVTGNTGRRFSDRAYFFDKCGKFTVGDTIKVIKK